jgi:hypothetical protein
MAALSLYRPHSQIEAFVVTGDRRLSSSYKFISETDD